jgi:hypothetical protein
VSVRALTGAYPSRFGQPILNAVDTRIFALRYFRNCLACGFCRDACCEHGVDVDRDNAKRLLELGDAFEAFVGTLRRDWFLDDAVADAEFPSGYVLRTAVKDGRCVFHTKDGRGCKIHAWCLDRDLDYRVLKPMVSTLFPVTFEHSVLVPSTEMLDGTLVCGGAGDTLFEGARDELAYFFGDGLIGELDALAKAAA